MTTGYKLNFATVKVNSRKKADRIIKALRQAGRHAYFEPFTDYSLKTDYIVFYWTVKGVL